VTQHAPSPDYRSYETQTLVTLDCIDCGDPCLVFTGATRCDTCEAEHKSELATATRLLIERSGQMIASALGGDPADVELVPYRVEVTPITQRSGGMNDPREILCEGCGEVAGTYTGSPDSLDGLRTMGECGCFGVYDVDQDDEGTVRARFLPRDDTRDDRRDDLEGE